MQATNLENTTVHNAISDVVRNILQLHNVQITKFYSTKRTSTHKSNICGRVCKFATTGVTQQAMQALNEALAQYNCKAVAVISEQLSVLFTRCVYVKILRIK